MFPGFQKAYQAWADTDNLRPLKRLVANGVRHWSSVASDMLACYEEQDDVNLSKLEKIVTENPL